MRKPDFWVVKKTVDGKEFWCTPIGPTEFCPCRSGRARYFSMTEAARKAESYPGSKAVPVYCATRKGVEDARTFQLVGTAKVGGDGFVYVTQHEPNCEELKR